MQLSDHNMSIFIEAFFSLCIFTHTKKRKKDKGNLRGHYLMVSEELFLCARVAGPRFSVLYTGPLWKKNMATRFCSNTAAPFFSLCCMFVVKVVVQPCYWFNSVLSMSEFTIQIYKYDHYCEALTPNLRAIVSWDSWLDYSRFKMNLFEIK